MKNYYFKVVLWLRKFLGLNIEDSVSGEEAFALYSVGKETLSHYDVYIHFKGLVMREIRLAAGSHEPACLITFPDWVSEDMKKKIQKELIESSFEIPYSSFYMMLIVWKVK
jgi:hypothetical protein